MSARALLRSAYGRSGSKKTYVPLTFGSLTPLKWIDTKMSLPALLATSTRACRSSERVTLPSPVRSFLSAFTCESRVRVVVTWKPACCRRSRTRSMTLRFRSFSASVAPSGKVCEVPISVPPWPASRVTVGSRRKALVRSEPGRSAGRASHCAWPGLYWLASLLLLACSARSPGTLRPVSSALT